VVQLLTIAFRTLFFYFAVLFVMRVMGKREMGNLSPFDLVVSIMIAELAALPIEHPEQPLLHGLLPLAVLLCAEVALSFASLKSERVRELINGTPSIIVAKGRLMEREMRRQRYTLHDLMVGLRSQGVFDLGEVEYAVLEPGGNLSVMPRAEKRPATPKDLGVAVTYQGLPLPLITDGHIHWRSVQEAGYGQEEFFKLLRQYNVGDFKAVLYAYLDGEKKFVVQLREKA
jgi:uncharacterized membrane protein YcaP (DUF421 family)